MAIHEAGHLVAIHVSWYFGLSDPAVQILNHSSFSALSCATRVRDTRAPEHHIPSTREFVRIAFAGKAAEDEFLRRQLISKCRLVPNPDGANHDLENVARTLAAMNIDHEREQLWQETVEFVCREWAYIAQVAQVILDYQGVEISRDILLKVLPTKP